MERRFYTPQEVKMILQEITEGQSVVKTARKHLVSKATLYRWKKRADHSGEQEISRLKNVAEENQRLKHLLAEAALEIQALKEQLKQQN